MSFFFLECNERNAPAYTLRAIQAVPFKKSLLFMLMFSLLLFKFAKQIRTAATIPYSLPSPTTEASQISAMAGQQSVGLPRSRIP